MEEGVYWVDNGVKLVLPLPPPMEDDWVLGSPVEGERLEIHQIAQEMLAVPLVRCKLLASSVNQTFELSLSDGRVVILRLVPFSGEEHEWHKHKFDVEIGVMRWLSGCKIPMPKVLCATLTEDAGFIAIEKLKGEQIFHVFGCMTESAKETLVQSYATAVLNLFRWRVPAESIGSISIGQSDQAVIVPTVRCDTPRFLDSVMDSLEDLIQYLVEACLWFRERVEDTATFPLSAKVLQRSKRVLISHASTFLTSSHLRRSTLHHDDLRPFNLLVDPTTGDLTGIIDWEYHSVQPAVLAAEYPSWLFYSGPDDPAFLNPSATLQKVWCVHQEEAERLSNLFRSIVREKDPEYYDCLVKGEKLRTAIRWMMEMSQVDPGCEMMAKWMEQNFDDWTRK